MNIWIKTQNNRKSSLKSSWVSSRSSLGTPLPVIRQSGHRPNQLSSSRYGCLLSEETESEHTDSKQGYINVQINQQHHLANKPQNRQDQQNSRYYEGYHNQNTSQQKVQNPQEIIQSNQNENDANCSYIRKSSQIFKKYKTINNEKPNNLSRSQVLNKSLNIFNNMQYKPCQMINGSSDQSSNSQENNFKKLNISSSIYQQQQQKIKDYQFTNSENNIFVYEKHNTTQKYRQSEQQQSSLSSNALFHKISHLSKPKQSSKIKSSLQRMAFKNSNQSDINSMLFKTSQDIVQKGSYAEKSKISSIYHSKNSNAQYPHTTHNSKRFLTTGRKNDIREHIVSIIQYCSNQVGIACYNMNTGQIWLSQIIERLTYTKTISAIQRFHPHQVIFSGTLESTPLIQQLMSTFKRSSFRPIKRNLFDQTKGYYIYKQRGNIKDEYNPDNKFLSFAALNALINFLQNSFEVTFSYNALNIKWHFLEQVLIIDSQTIRDLEIFINYQTKKSDQQTFIDNFKCLTDGGTRMLRANILQPLTKISAIKQRQSLVRFLLQNRNISQMLAKQLIKFKHYEPITAKFIQSPKQQNLKSIKSYLQAIYSLSKLCFEFQNFKEKLIIFENQSPIIDNLLKKLSDRRLQTIRSLIRTNFDEDILKNFSNVKLKNKKDNFIFLFRVQKIDDQFAEISRLTYSHTLQDIFKIFEQIKNKCKGNYTLKLQYNQYRGYYISAKAGIDLSQLSKNIQSDILHITFKNNTVTFSTDILSSMNNRLKQNQNKLIFQSESLLIKIIRQIQTNLEILFEINYSISIIDMLLAFSKFVSSHTTSYQIKFTQPQFIKQPQSQIVLQKLRPVWSAQKFHKLSQQISFEVSPQTKMINMLKDHNSTNQLTLMTSLGYLTILAQMGCLVPAKKYKVQIFTMIISKINVQQNFENNLSRFQTQLYALKNVLDNSQSHDGKCLIFIDQLLRGTQPQQQWALTLSASQSLLNCQHSLSILLISDQIVFNLMKKLPKTLSWYYQDQQNKDPQTQSKISSQIRLMLREQYNFNNQFLTKFDEIDTATLQKINL